MIKDGKNDRPSAGEDTGPHDGSARSGEGANTALEALIRKRRLQGADNTDEQAMDNLPPAPPT